MPRPARVLERAVLAQACVRVLAGVIYGGSWRVVASPAAVSVDRVWAGGLVTVCAPGACSSARCIATYCIHISYRRLPELNIVEMFIVHAHSYVRIYIRATATLPRGASSGRSVWITGREARWERRAKHSAR